ncbi:ATP-binding protein [Oribacterium sinus]|uniref:ATP-binding protein n=1 Tax=Oribacterium sinus TaxID=237576 RepID=UPI0028E9EA7B|nr:AAA family ATPase [Oribacterium sinus]
MILEKLYIDGFGKFSDYSLNFSPSIQILYGENEAGKSTIHAFIQAMLYGIPKGASKKEIFFQYRPFSKALGFGGSLTFSHQGKSYCVQRDFLQGGEAHITILPQGEKLFEGESFLQDLLSPFSLESFKNTVSIRQLKSSTEREMVYELQAMLSNFQESGNVELNPQAALDYLEQEEARLREKMIPDASKRYSGLLGEVKNTHRSLSLLEAEEAQFSEEKSLKGLAPKEAMIEETDREETDGEEIDGKRKAGEESFEKNSSVVKNCILKEESLELQRKVAEIEETREEWNRLSSLLEKEGLSNKEELLLEQEKMLQYLSHEQEEKELGKSSIFLYPLFCFFALCFAVLTILSFLYAYTSVALPRFPFFSMGFSAYLYPFFCAFLLFLLLALSQRRIFTQQQRWVKQEKREFEEILAKRNISTFLQFQNSSKEELREEGSSYTQAKVLQYYNTLLEKWGEKEELEKSLALLEESYQKEKNLWLETSYKEKQKEQREELLRQYGILQNKADLIRPSLEENEKLQEKREALLEAKERIRQIAGEIRKSFAFHLNEDCGKALSEITGGRYDSLWIDEQLHIYVNAKEGFFPLEQASTGTIDQLYLALRLSMALLLQRENRDLLPLLFDDSFAMYDEKRLAASIGYLKKAYPAQILLFTCHHREEKILKELGIPFEQAELK